MSKPAKHTLEEVASAYKACHWNVAKTAKRLGYGVRYTYASIAKARESGLCPKLGYLFEPKKEKVAQDSVIVLSVKLPTPAATADIQVRDSGGILLGTVCVGQAGICYRRPNQKGQPDRRLSWTNLDRLMQLGLLS
jgi:hypothetical protein